MAYLLRTDLTGVDITTIATGGPCSSVVEAQNADDLTAALQDLPEAICIGGGSNMLISDAGTSVTLIRAAGPATGNMVISGTSVLADATASWDEFVLGTIDAGLSGLESTSGIPGTVGGALVQNAGAYGQEIGEVVDSVQLWDREEKQLVWISAQECDFAYRHSRFKHDDSRRWVVVRVKVNLEKATHAQPRYGDVSVLLNNREGHSGPYPLLDVRNAVIDVRRSKGMVIGASLPSAGSFFTNPMLNDDQVARVEAANISVLVRSDGQQSASAAQLISAAGFSRGHVEGNVGLSDQHVLALVNRGHATTDELIQLARRIALAVHDKFGISLKPEPVMLGFLSSPFNDLPSA